MCLRVCVWGWLCTFHLLAAWRGSGCTRRGELDRHLISWYLLLCPSYCVVCLTYVKSGGLIKPTVRQALAHKRDDESWEWSGLWWILVLSCTDRGGGLRPAYWEKLAVCGWKRQCIRWYYNAAFKISEWLVVWFGEVTTCGSRICGLNLAWNLRVMWLILGRLYNNN